MSAQVVSSRELSRAVEAISDGGVVAIPTDTVYGLAAGIEHPGALDALFALKERPADLALPVLIGKWRQVFAVVREWPREASYLGSRFWPGALTVIAPSRPELGRLVGGDGESVGVRLPDHRFVRQLCRRVGPLAVTSANRHGAPPATNALEVAQVFSDAAELTLIVDGGTCDGAPSTVVDCTVLPPRCVRQGAVPWEWVLASLR